MQQVVDWIEGNAWAIIGGSLLFVAVLVVYVAAARKRHVKVKTDSDDPGIQV